jgi:hypothetical protein
MHTINLCKLESETNQPWVILSSLPFEGHSTEAASRRSPFFSSSRRLGQIDNDL